VAQTTYLEAIRQALGEEMERDPSVFLMGEDIAEYGGAFKVTEGFLARFGPDRVIDTPIVESGMMGAAAGAALMGMRPVVEIQFIDFIANAFDQLVNFIAKSHWRWGEPMPLVVRGPGGGGVRAGPFHSQNPEGWLQHVPGLKIVQPATAYDAKGLLKAAIRDPDPVLYLEHKMLYRRIKDDLPDTDYEVPIGKALVRRSGRDVSLLTYGAMVHRCLEAAVQLAAQGIEAEVVDLRTLLPLDRRTVIESVQRTSKVVIVHEDTRTGGIGESLAAIIQEEAFESLDAPVRIVGALDTPVPYSPPLEEFFLPSEEQVERAARLLVAY
jgi:2-oxoisovalerate dehydrogenase E1 component beta subunit